MKNWSTIAASVLVCSMIANAVGAGCLFILQKKLNSARQSSQPLKGKVMPIASGVDLANNSWKSNNSPCRVVRLTDDNCLFCKKDVLPYTVLLEQARQSSCEIIEISPHAGKMSPNPRRGVVQLTFVDADLGELAPFVTPTTLVLDQNYSIQWSRRGILDENSLADALSALQVIRAREQVAVTINIAATNRKP